MKIDFEENYRVVSGNINRAAAFMSGRMFIFSWIFFNSSRWFSERASVVGKIPLVPSFFGLAVLVSAVFVVVIASLFESLMLALHKAVSVFYSAIGVSGFSPRHSKAGFLILAIVVISLAIFVLGAP